MNHIIPKPIREIAFTLNNALNKKTSYTNPMLRTAMRLTLAAAGVFLALKFGTGLALGLIAGGVISLPATLIAVGSYAAYVGLTSTIGAIAGGSLTAFASGLGLAVAGWFILEHYDFTAFGFVESHLIDPAARFLTPITNTIIAAC